MTREELRRYRDIIAEREQIETLLSLLRSGVPLTGGKTGGVRPKKGLRGDLSGAAVTVDELAALYERKRRDLLAAQKRIEAAIETLTGRERRLIRARYIEGKRWEAVADEMCYSWRQVQRIHAAALKKLQKK